MMGYPFYLVDVFAETKYAGNQLAVISNAAAMPATLMQNIALEMNYSETAFIISDHEKNGGYDVRIFTPGQELPFAGHPTLGTAFIIQQYLLAKKVPSVKLNLQVGQISVDFSYNKEVPDLLWMKQVEPEFGQLFGIEEAAGALGIAPGQLDHDFPVQEVSTGLPFIIVPLKSLEAVRSIAIDSRGYEALIEKARAKSILVFCPETYSPANQINARMFDQYHGIAEDPATGSANGCLAAYLVKHRYFGSNQVDLRVEQGYEIGRPSLLFLKAREEAAGGPISVFVGGRVIMIARGELL